VKSTTGYATDAGLDADFREDRLATAVLQRHIDWIVSGWRASPTS
jgi:hypothetical protein